MPKLQERLNKVGNVVKFEAFAYENLTRKDSTVTYGTDMQVGEVLILASNKYRRIVSADISGIATASLAVLVDDRIEELMADDQRLQTPTNDVTAALMRDIKAPVTLRSGGLRTVSLTDANRTAIFARLEALDFKIADYYSTQL